MEQKLTVSDERLAEMIAHCEAPVIQSDKFFDDTLLALWELHARRAGEAAPPGTSADNREAVPLAGMLLGEAATVMQDCVDNGFRGPVHLDRIRDACRMWLARWAVAAVANRDLDAPEPIDEETYWRCGTCGKGGLGEREPCPVCGAIPADLSAPPEESAEEPLTSEQAQVILTRDYPETAQVLEGLDGCAVQLAGPSAATVSDERLAVIRNTRVWQWVASEVEVKSMAEEIIASRAAEATQAGKVWVDEADLRALVEVWVDDGFSCPVEAGLKCNETMPCSEEKCRTALLAHFGLAPESEVQDETG